MSSVAVNMKSRGLSAPLDWLSRLGGPMVTKELRVASRRRRTYLLRFAYLVALTAYAAWAWMNEIEWYGTRSAADVLRTAVFAEGVTARILLFQFVALPAIAIVMLSTSITEEIQRRTLSVLMTTPVSAFRIVLGKMLSQVFQLSLLLAISLPLLVLLQVFGGVPREAVAVGLTVTLTTCILAGSLSMLVSTVFRRAYMAVLVTVVVMLAALVGQELAMVRWAQYWIPSDIPTLGQLLMALSPIRWLLLIAPDPTRLLAFYSTGSLAFLLLFHVLMLVGFSALILAWTARRLRRVGLRLATGELRPAVRWEQIMRLKRGGRPVLAVWLRRVTGSPVLWRERQVRFGPSRMAVIVAWAVLFSVIFSLDALAFGFQLLAPDIFPAVAVLLWAATVLVAMVQPAPAIAGEREAGTLAILLVTPLPRERIVLDKALGAVWRSMPVWGLLVAHLVVFTAFGRVHPIVLIHVALALAGTLAFVAGAGLLWSAYARRTATAMAMNLGLVALVFVAPPVVGQMSGNNPYARTLAGVQGLVHPAVHVYVVTQGAVLLPGLGSWGNPDAMPRDGDNFDGYPNPWSSAPLRYLWPYPLEEQDWVVTSLLIAQISLVWFAGGCLLGALAARRLEKGEEGRTNP